MHSLRQVRSIRRPGLCLAGAALALGAALPAQAQQLRSGVDIRVGGEVTSNPYLEQGADGASATVTGSVQPWLVFDGERTTYTVNGSFDGRAFADRYDPEDNYGLSTSVYHRANERLTLTANAGIFSSASRVSSLTDRIGGVDGPPLPSSPNDIDIGDDITLLGLRGRSTVLTAGAGGSMTFDARNQLAIDGNYSKSWYEQANAQDFQSYGAEGRYSHVLDQSTTLGAVLSYQLTNYEQADSGDARTVTTMGSVIHRLGQYWTFDASAGASFTRIDATALNPALDSTSFSVRAKLCGRNDRRGLCLDYTRLPQATAFGGVRNSDAVGLSFDDRLSERDRVTVSTRYSRSGGSTGVFPVVPTIQYLNMQGQFQRQFSQRLTGFVAGSLAQTFRPDLSIEPNLSLGAGVTVQLGQLR